jgi:thioredoxin reductase (NADPH)
VTGVRTRDQASGETSEIELGGIFVYVGLQPNTELLADLLALDADGRVPTDPTMRTELPGVLAAGILRRGSLGQAAISAGEGAAAAKAADRYLTDGSWAQQPAALATGNGGSHG